jgi:hypothetical protein
MMSSVKLNNEYCMKLTLPAVFGFLLLFAPAEHAQFDFTTNNGAITITGYNTAAGLNVVIPAMTNGYPVTSIGNNAFQSSGITNVTIPDSVTSIGSSVFGGCTRLTSVAIPNSVTSIGIFAFASSGITSVTIPNSVTSIGVSAFNNCTNLTSINVDAANPAYSSLGGVLFDKALATLLEFPGGLGGSYTIPNGVTSIGTNAFYNCSSLTNVTIPNSVTSIGNDAFGLCTSLTSVTIPNSVTSIGYGAFSYCTSLANVSIPNSVTSLGAWAFYNCTSLTSVTIPNSVTSIGGVAGGEFGNGMFQFCYSLTNVIIPKSVTNIGDWAFAYCTSLTSVTIPASVTNIGAWTFVYCTSLTSAYFLGNAPPDDGTVFASDPATVYYLAGTTGWGSTFGSVPAVLWNPHSLSPGFTAGQFGFNVTGSSNLVIVVEACTNLSNPTWTPVGTNTLNGGSSYFSDPQWTNYTSRFYRLRSP